MKDALLVGSRHRLISCLGGLTKDSSQSVSILPQTLQNITNEDFATKSGGHNGNDGVLISMSNTS
jgi:hypothetical protein